MNLKKTFLQHIPCLHKKAGLGLFLAMLASSPTAQAQTDTPDEIVVTNEKGEREVIDLPEALSIDLDSLLRNYNNQTYLKIDTDCDMPNINPVYEKEVFIERLGRLPNIIEMPYNDAVQKVIDRYTNRLRRSVSLMLGAQNFYMPIFEQALETYGLPLELKYLPIIESGLNPFAVSRVGATGLWQFMLATGKQYGLEVNSLVDDRRDPVKSSYAAARYMADQYKIFGDWNLVIAAYNCGPDNINKAIHRAGGSTDYWKIYPYLPAETRGYVPAFIAANYIMNYYCEHNICPMLSELPIKTDTVMVDRDVHFEQIAQVLNIDIEQLKVLNPQYRRNIVNGSTRLSAIRLPEAMTAAFIDHAEEIYSYKNDVLLTKRSLVAVEEKAPASRNSRSARNKGRNSGNSGSSSVTVRKGDTLSAIAKRNGTTVAKIQKLNGMSGTNIRAGQKIKVK